MENLISYFASFSACPIKINLASFLPNSELDPTSFFYSATFNYRTVLHPAYCLCRSCDPQHSPFEQSKGMSPTFFTSRKSVCIKPSVYFWKTSLHSKTFTARVYWIRDFNYGMLFLLTIFHYGSRPTYDSAMTLITLIGDFCIHVYGGHILLVSLVER